MKNLLTGVLATAMALSAPLAANAATFTSLLEYRDGLVGAQTPYGTVTLDELDANTVKVTVTLANAASLFVNTGGPHDPFLFNTQHDNLVTVQPPVGTFSDAGHGAFQATPFGTFTDKIACCSYVSDVYAPDVYPADVYVGHGAGRHILHHAGDPIPGHNHIVHHAGDELNGAANGQAGPLVFTVSNLAGLTFAGLGYTTDANGKVLELGTGEHFVSNAGGWWFSADIFDGATGRTYNVAARDAMGPRPPLTSFVPEPATWAMMLLGFGGMGVLLRRSRRLARTATA